MGIYAVYENAIRIMIPRDLHLGDEDFDQLKVGDRIRVEIQKSRFQLRDPFIVSVGLYRGLVGAHSVPVTNVPNITAQLAKEPESEVESEAESETTAESEEKEE
jgi:hypothetical protein